MDAKVFHLLPLASARGRIFYFKALFLINTCQEVFISYLHVAYDPLISKRERKREREREICSIKHLEAHFLIFIKTKCHNFCLLNIILYLCLER